MGMMGCITFTYEWMDPPRIAYNSCTFGDEILSNYIVFFEHMREGYWRHRVPTQYFTDQSFDVWKTWPITK